MMRLNAAIARIEQLEKKLAFHMEPLPEALLLPRIGELESKVNKLQGEIQAMKARMGKKEYA